MSKACLYSVCIVLGLVLGCDSGSEEDQAPKRPRPAVNLPDSPPLVIPEKAQMLDDGSYSVAGLLESASEGFDREVRVKGQVLERHSCRDADPGSLCPPAHFILVDSLEFPETQLLVVASEDVLGTVEESTEEIVSGRFVQWSSTKWYVRSEGMVEIMETEE